METGLHQLYGEILDRKGSRMCVLAPDYSIVHVNQSWADAINIAPDQSIGESIMSFLSEEQLEILRQSLHMAALGNDTGCELTLNVLSDSKSGSEWDIKAVFDSIGTLEYYLMTDRQRHQKTHSSRREQLQAMTVEIVKTLTNKEAGELDFAIEMALKKIGEYLSAGRVYIHRYDFDSNTLQNVYEWCGPDINPARQHFQHITLDLVPEWLEQHKRGEQVFIPDTNADSLEPSLRKQFKRRGITSILLLPLINSGRCLGCLGVDILGTSSPWEEHIREILDVISGVIAQAIDRVETEGSLIAARQKAEQAASIKDEFLASLSHEIRTPLNGMLGLIEMLKDTDTSQQQRKLLKNLLSSSKLLLRVVEEIYELNDIRTDTSSLQHSNIRFIDLVDEISVLFKERMHDKNIRFSHDVNAADVFRGPYLQIRQVLLNLIGNAVKCSEEGDVELKATFSGLKQAGSGGRRPELQVSIEVQNPKQDYDTDSYFGSGHELKQGLYDWSGDLNAFPGSRLGLIVSKQLIEKMNGRLNLGKTKGNQAGLCIWFVLPVERAEKSAKGNLKTAGSGAGFRSVLVQNEGEAPESQEQPPGLILLGSLDVSLIVLSRQLDSEAVNHRICKSNDEARQALEKCTAPSAQKADDCQLFVDLNIGKEAALSFINEIKNQPEFINLHVSLLHAADQSISEDWIEAYDLDRIVQKPISTAQLREMLEHHETPFPESSSESEDKTAPADGIERSPLTSEKSFPDLRVLVAEDNKVNRMLIKFILDRLNLRELKIVENGLQALEAVKTSENAFDLILMDCQMPVMGGFEASRQIRALPDARKAGSHITAVTAFATSTYSKHSIEAGMDDYITKPYTIARIQELLSAVSAGKKQEKSGEITSEAAEVDDIPEYQSDLNMEKLRRRFDNNEVLVQEMLEMFLNDSNWQLEQLREFAAEQNWKALYDLNHQLKGAAATMSAEYLFTETSALQAYMEQDATEYDISRINKFIQELGNSFSRIRKINPDKKKPSQ